MPDNVVTRITQLLPKLHSDTRANLVAWTDAQLTRLFDDGLREHATRSGAFVKRNFAFVDLIQSVVLYDLPGDLLSVVRVSLNNVSLVPSTTTELEVLDEAFQFTQGVPTNWYTDREGDNRIGVWPVPNLATTGATLDIIYHYYDCSLDEAHVNVAIPTPLITGDLLELRTLAEAYGHESDMAQPEVTQATRQIIKQLYEPGYIKYYGMSQ